MTSFTAGLHNSAFEAVTNATSKIHQDYSLVLLASGIALSLSSLHGLTVGAHYRKRAGIEYPQPFATDEQCRTNPAAFTFNCAQRCHANYVENLLPMVGSMLVVGLKHPRRAAALGAVWVLARVFYRMSYVKLRRENVEEGGVFGSGLTPVGWWMPQWRLHFMVVQTAFNLVYDGNDA